MVLRQLRCGGVLEAVRAYSSGHTLALQPHVSGRGCNRVRQRLQPYVAEAATVCEQVRVYSSGYPDRMPIKAFVGRF